MNNTSKKQLLVQRRCILFPLNSISVA